ncbi:hypothetical protein NliqN6_6806 [Naganishia liquefaciens]|uniref:F-box only protein 9 n=1 Tax=Naganishia liquefaciens TaxID=104408 RepID=A0A8H3U0C7_9TREE|nr:hypothetical protein NliqN6_6806 [Naganishia liquefaciens]
MTDASEAIAQEELEKFREQWRREVQDRARQRDHAEQKRPAKATDSIPGTQHDALPTVQKARERPPGILDASRKEEDKIQSGILQDEVELARAIGSVHLSTGHKHVVRPTPPASQTAPPGKTQEKAVTSAPPTSPKSKQALTSPKPVARREHGPATVSTKKAVEAYARAVEHENSGQLNEALHLYRKAFKLDDRVEKAYNSAIVKEEERSQAVVEETQVVDPALPVTATPPPLEPYVFRTHTQLGPDYHSPARTPVRSHADGEGVHAEWTDPLTRIINKFEDDLYTVEFAPEEEKWPVLLATMPDEVIENIIFFLDVQSLERFALTCKKARLLTRIAPVWRHLCERIYVPPLVPPDIKPYDLAKHHGFDWRSTFLEERRLRYDGVYISVCHYIRPGQSDMAWVNPTHLITYHRFLRFYPDGRVISYLTTDLPVDVVHSVRPSLRAKGTLFGQWEICTMKDEKGRDVPKIELRSLLEPGVTPKYEFEMDLCLKTTHRGRWNKLEMLTYQSVNLLNGEALGLSLKHQKPFYFSKVRSYKEQL